MWHLSPVPLAFRLQSPGPPPLPSQTSYKNKTRTLKTVSGRIPQQHAQICPRLWDNGTVASPWQPQQSRGTSTLIAMWPRSLSRTLCRGCDSNRKEPGLLTSFSLKQNFLSHILRSGFLRDLWPSHLCHLLIHSHLPGRIDTVLFCFTSQASFILSKKVTRSGLETAKSVYSLKKKKMSFTGDSPISNPVCAQVKGKDIAD